ncbi:hypothetical protein [Nocardioides panaciterrulae]|uniref:Uncharacterized protein n=1 Tax=Nocardioides panaciterrulae TaxID=661492 RepID=A0A7Y9E4M5_9ACTN|nr:hypothetical protein [Nocardioides panaciterrulae]NYD41104.1 hypothetical protein [Nocardioides panaciterrulae]
MRRPPAVSTLLVDQIDEALTALDDARAELARVVAARSPLRDHREAHARVRRAFDEADALLRQATATARQHSYREWALWRHRLSSLDVARQIHLFAEQDEPGLLQIGSVRAIDTGMSGPDIGDLQHGRSRAPGALPTYGLDLEELLTAPAGVGSTTGDPPEQPRTEPPARQAAADPPKAAGPTSPVQAA